MNTRKENQTLFPVTQDTVLVTGKWNLCLKSPLAEHSFLKKIEVHDDAIHIDDLEHHLCEQMREKVKIIAAREYK